MRGLEEMKRLREMFGAYGVTATPDVGANTRKLQEKVKAASEFNDVERVMLVRALDWCIRQDRTTDAPLAVAARSARD